MTGHPGSGVLRRIEWIADRFADVFSLVIETSRDFMEAIGLARALAELTPRTELLPWRSAITAASKLPPASEGHRLRIESKLQPVNFAGIASSLLNGSAAFRRKFPEACDGLAGNGAKGYRRSMLMGARLVFVPGVQGLRLMFAVCFEGHRFRDIVIVGRDGLYEAEHRFV